MKIKIIICLAFMAVVTFAAISASRNRPFSPASDLPRDALVYVQFEDLPAFINLWNQSKFKTKYLESQNFKDLSNRHLGLKLASRWQEFSDAAGFPLDLETISGVAEKRAAVAIYDIGRLDFVFIAPMKKELFEASRLMQNAGNFEEEELDSGITIYRVSVDADRGRQKQELLFTNVKGRLIIATSEKLMARTMSVVTGKSRKDSLADDPAFATLAAATQPRSLAVWADQAALNSDYYFKRYWLMQGVEGLKNLRAGLFNLTISNGEIVENRKFLLNKAGIPNSVPAADAGKLLSSVPDNIPFYKLQDATRQTLQHSLGEVVSTIHDAARNPARKSRYSRTNAYYDYGDGDDLGNKFDQYIDDVPEADEDTVPDSKAVDYRATLGASAPRTILTLAKTSVKDAPRFVDFDRAAVIMLNAPAALDRAAFEAAVSQDLARHLLIDDQRLDTHWSTKTENGSSWRELDAPMLGWSVAYSIVGNRLIVANDPSFLRDLLQSPVRHNDKAVGPISEYAVLKPSTLRPDFQYVFESLSQDDGDFFVGNIASLIDSAPPIDKVETRKAYAGKILEEEIRMTFQK